MEEKINIAAILKDKSQGTKLYDWLHNIDIELDTISTTDTETVVWCTNETNNNTTCHRGYSEFGTERGYPDGLQILFPSKSMRDWEKFSWKNGDVLKNTAYEERVIFDGFLNDDYTYFKGKHPLDCSDKFNISYHEECNCFTGNYRLESTDAAQTYINAIEERLGGKLNSDTLEIEKTQPEFKDGDVLFVKCYDSAFIEIFKYSKNNGDLYDRASLDTTNQILDISGRYRIGKDEITEIRLATEAEKQQLFSALKKEGKAWDAEKKMIVNLKQKFDELKPFDKVVVRCSEADRWSIDFFSHKVHNGYICTGDAWFGYCLPYNEETSHLLGTTDDWEGGEQ